MRLVRVAVNVEQLLYRSPGGVGRYTAQVATRLPGVEVLPFTALHAPRSIGEELRRRGVRAKATVLPLPRPVLYEAWHRRDGAAGPQSLSRRLRRADVVHLPSVACPPHGPAPMVVAVHDAAPVLFPEAYPARGLRFHLAGIEAARRRADVVLSFSEAAADEVASHTGIARERIRVVPHGVDAPPPDPAGERALGRWGLAGRRFVFWVGSTEPRKGLGTLVAAMARLPRRGDLKLVLAGPPGWLSAGIDDADRATVGGDLVHLGPVSEAELWALYRAAAVVAVPSRHEGFGYPVLEAMAAGTPVVASDIGALREVAGGAARLVPAGDVEGWVEALADVLGDASAAGAMAEAGRRRAAALTVDASMRGTVAVYASLL